MEYVIAFFLGGWLAAASVISWRRLKREFAPWIGGDEEK